MKTTFIFILLFGSLILFSQEKIKVKGKIKSELGVDIVGVAVTINSKHQNIDVQTDSLGRFEAELGTGSVKIIANHFGYLKNECNLRLTRDTLISLILKGENALLKEVFVSKQKNSITDFSGGKISLNLKSLSSLPSLFGSTDVIKIIQLMPGVQNSGDANGYLYVRGGDPGHNSILYAGIPVYGMSHLLGIFPFYNSDHISEVEFDKSSSNAKYGGHLSSTTLLKPIKTTPSRLALQGSVGLLASQFSLSLPLTPKTGIYWSMRKTYIDEVITPIERIVYHKNDLEKKKYSFLDSNLSFISNLTSNNVLTIDAFLSADKLNIGDTNLELDSNLKWGNFSVSPTLTSKLSKKTSMSNSFYYTQYFNCLSMTQSTLKADVLSNVKDFGFKNAINFILNKIPFESGLQYVIHNTQPQNLKILNNSSIINSNDEKKIKTKEFSWFISSKINFHNNMNADLGLRMDYYNFGSNSNLYIQPRIVLNYILDKTKSFYFSFNKQNQYLHLITSSSVGIPTDYWVSSTGNIKPQSSIEYSIGVKHEISNVFKFSSGGFYRSLKNLLEYPYGITQFNEISTIENDLVAGKGKSYGLEILFQKAKGNLKGWLSYTLSWSERNFPALNDGNSFFAKYDRRHNLSIVGMYELSPKWDFGITQIITSGNRFTMPTSWYFINNNPVKEYSGYNNAQMPNYVRTDFSVNYYFVKDVFKESALNFSIYNTFNIDNPIYIVLNVKVDESKKNAIVLPEKKVLYRILPSISWKFKF